MNNRSLAISQGLFGGVLAGISFSQGGLLLMAPALALLWASSSRVVSSFLWGFFALLLSHRWLLALHPLTWLGFSSSFSLLIALSIWLGCALLGGLLVSAWSLLGKILSSFISTQEGIWEGCCYAIVMACVWGITETILAKFPLFWIGISGSLLPEDRFLAGLARVIGSGGLAAIELLLGWWLWKLYIAFRLQFCWRRILFIGLTFLFSFHLIGWGLLRSVEPSASVSIAVWQTSIPIREKFSDLQINRLPFAIRESLDRSNDLKADFLVAPEGLLPSEKFVQDPVPIPFLTGGFRWVNGTQRSSMFAFNREGIVPSAIIDKNRLVPLGEWIPPLLGKSFKGLSAIGGLQPGSSSRLFQWQGPSAAVAICYELSDGNLLAKAVKDGAQWMLSIANLDPYPISLQKQFIALAQLRSIETDRDLLSVANTGPSALILPNGKTQILVPPFSEGLSLAEVQLSKGKTIYVRWGNYPLIFAMIFGLLVSFGKRFGVNLFRK